jgi:hypothetical protein
MEMAIGLFMLTLWSVNAFDPPRKVATAEPRADTALVRPGLDMLHS